MVQANPQILQVCVYLISFSSTSNLLVLLARSKVVNLGLVSGYASGAWEAEPSTFEIDPGPSSRVSPVNK